MHFIVALVRCIYHAGRETDSSACKAIERGQSDKKLITSHTNNVRTESFVESATHFDYKLLSRAQK